MSSAFIRGLTLLRRKMGIDSGVRLVWSGGGSLGRRYGSFQDFSVELNNTRTPPMKHSITLSEDVRIELDKPSYRPGDDIKGNVHFTFRDTKKVRGIFINFTGLAETYWVKVRPEHDYRAGTSEGIMARTARERYFDIQYYVVGSEDGEQIEIPQGTHTYDLVATLPRTLPSSFKGEFGKIRYTVAATLDRPWKLNQETKVDFVVVNELDLNSNRSYKGPLNINIEKTFWCLNCTTGPLVADLTAPSAAYVPGQTITFNLQVDNKSHVALKYVAVKLRELATYRSKLPHESTKETKNVVAEVTSPEPVASGESKQFSLNLVVPQLTPSKLVGCGIIDLDYDIRMECKVEGAHISPAQEQLITIGTVPIS